MIMLEKAQDPKQQPHNHGLRLAERLGLYDHKKLDLTSPVFESFEAMIEAAGEPVEKPVEKPVKKL